jgi:hypothetical protein
LVGIATGDGATGDGTATAAGDGTATAAAAAAAAAPVFRFALHLPVCPQTHSSLASHSGFSFITEHLLPPEMVILFIQCIIILSMINFYSN